MTARPGAPRASLEAIIVAHVARCRFDDLPATAVDATRSLILDTFSAILAARDVPDVVRLAELVRGWGGDEAALIGTPDRALAHHAALLNGTMARTLEIDDVHETATLHATATILPVALAAAELTGSVSGRDLLTAVAIGIDLCARISLSMSVDLASAAGPTRTMSYTYQTGILAGALVAARLLGMDEAGIRNTLGVAYSQCAGNQQALFEGVATVRVQQGLSAMTAVLSARLSLAGVTGVQHSLEGSAGFFNAFHRGKFDREVLTDRLGTFFEVENVSIKPFPCCKYTHTAIAAALEARRHPDFALSSVTEIVAQVNHREYYEIVCRPDDPGERRRQLAGPDGRVRAQFCLAYVVAVALKDGEVGLDHFEERGRADPATLALMDRVRTTIAADAPGRVLPVPGIISVHLKGRSAPIQAEVSVARGHPANRMPFDEVVEKLWKVAGRTHEQQPAIKALVEMITDIDQIDDARVILAILARYSGKTAAAVSA